MTAVVGDVKPEAGLQLRSLVKGNGELELSLVDVPVPEPGPDEVLIRIEATPLNPSDLGLLFGFRISYFDSRNRDSRLG